MKFKSLKRWVLTKDMEGLLFFAQRLDELLWDFTLDTHKPMTLNTPYLCQEALALTQDIEANLIEPANLKHVLEELIWSVQNDPIAKDLLDLPIEHYVLQGDDIKQTEQRLRLDVLARTLDPYRYLNRCFDHISRQVRAIEKKKLDASARTLVTTLINMGVSKRSLHDRTSEFFFAPNGPSIDAVDVIDEFLRKLYPYAHEYNVFFVVSNLIRTVEDSLSKFRIKLLDELPEDIRDFGAINGFLKGADQCFVEVGKFQGFDVISAQESAANRLDNLSDLFTLFYHKKKITWEQRAIVKQCCLDGPVLVVLSKGAMEKPFDLKPEKASKELNRLLSNFSTKGNSFIRFNRVADLHGICVSTDITENQLVTLWTSLETLVPSTATTSKITNVLEAMIPFLMLAYTKRLVQRFNHDLVIWKPWTAKSLLTSVPHSKGANTLQRTLALLAIADNEPIRTRMYSELGDFQLLRFRAFQLAEILSTPKKLQLALTAHEQKLRWQIRRIYRTRNLIIHSGRHPSYIHSLVENAHDYVDQLIFDVMKLSCGEYKISTLEQAFELTKVKYKRFSDRLGEIDSFDAANCAFLCEDLDSLEHYETQAWGDRDRGMDNAQTQAKPRTTAHPSLRVIDGPQRD